MKTPTDMKTKAPSRGDLELMLRPAGGGIHVVSTGVAELQALQMTLYGAESPEDVMTKWRSSLDAIGDNPVVVLGFHLTQEQDLRGARIERPARYALTL